MKVGIIRCMQTRDYCASGRDFRTILGHKDAFADVDEDIEITGFVDCGGCPGKKAVLRARLLVAQGADTIAFASCIAKGTPLGYPCPFAKRMRDLVARDVGDNIRIIDYTHEAAPEQ
ncbi:MAG: CGGC domain-containing protein [Peptococcaceae bacterium]|nr:CGGC domain-containing protein [Peptococcaceae bacterium]